ncbi:MAG: LPXTG cell wall anchor domain-containing protein [Oscillospiraceae bacterium]|nr:LPXTG cell wall anchor domain-containing protein [Oscillospiraceae bacterium]
MKKNMAAKLIALVMTALIVLSLTPIGAFAEAPTAIDPQVVPSNTATTLYYKGAATADSSDWDVALAKTIKQRTNAGEPIENEFTISLDVQAKTKFSEVPLIVGANIVLVLDLSQSMDSPYNKPGTSTSTTNWKELVIAADSFIDKMLGADSQGKLNPNDNRIAIVAYGYEQRLTLKWTDSATEAKNSYRYRSTDVAWNQTALIGTHYASADAFRAARMDDDLGYTNGEAGFYGADVALDTAPTRDYGTPLEYVVFMSDGEVNARMDGNGETLTTGNHVMGAKNRAAKLKLNHPSAKIYTVAFNINSLTAAQVLKRFNAVITVWSSGDGFNQGNSSVDAYYEGSANNIETIYNTISQRILDESQPTTVSDPMGAHIALDGAVITNNSNVSEANGGFNWDLSKVEPTKTENNINYYHLEYNITLDTLSNGFEKLADYATNGATTLSYFTKQTVSGKITINGPYTVAFDVPKVEGYSAYPLLTFKKTDGPNPIEGVPFTATSNELILTGTNAGQYRVISGASNAQGVVTFDLPSGHSYIIKEVYDAGISAIYNQDTTTEYAVSVNWGAITGDLKADGTSEIVNEPVQIPQPVSISVTKFFEIDEEDVAFDNIDPEWVYTFTFDLKNSSGDVIGTHSLTGLTKADIEDLAQNNTGTPLSFTIDVSDLTDAVNVFTITESASGAYEEHSYGWQLANPITIIVDRYGKLIGDDATNEFEAINQVGGAIIPSFSFSKVLIDGRTGNPYTGYKTPFTFELSDNNSDWSSTYEISVEETGGGDTGVIQLPKYADVLNAELTLLETSQSSTSEKGDVTADTSEWTITIEYGVVTGITKNDEVKETILFTNEYFPHITPSITIRKTTNGYNGEFDFAVAVETASDTVSLAVTDAVTAPQSEYALPTDFTGTVTVTEVDSGIDGWEYDDREYTFTYEDGVLVTDNLASAVATFSNTFTITTTEPTPTPTNTVDYPNPSPTPTPVVTPTTTPDVTPEITPEPTVEIPDEEPPLAELPPLVAEVEKLPEVAPEVEIGDDETPLADAPIIPKTGDSGIVTLALLGLTATAGAAIIVLKKKAK